MLDHLTSLSASLAVLWEMSVTAAYAAAVVVVLRLLLKKRAPRQVICLLWLVVFARLLIPVSLESPLSIVPDALAGQEQAAAPAPGDGLQTPAGGETDAVLTTPEVQGGGEAFPVMTAPSGAVPSTPRPEPEAPFPWQALAAGVWLAGAVVMGGAGLLSYVRLRRRLFDAIRARDGAWEHPAVDSPFILGIVRPRIYLPIGLVGQPRKFILCHERAHLRRLDHIVKPICWVALALHWFNPMVWAAFILMSRDIEAACDEAVLRRLGPEVKADYSTTLLALATGGKIPAPCPLAFDEGDAKGRVKNVLRYRRPALWIVVVSVVMAVMAAVCLLTDPVSAKAPGDDPDAAPSQAPEENWNALADPWMLEVLGGERTFSPDGDVDYNIHQLRSMVYGDEELPKMTVEVGKLAILDLDRDGINEMVVWPTGEHDDPTEVGYYTGYFVFRRQGDEVTVYYPGWRPMERLKADGTFSWSGSAFEWGTGCAAFDADGMFSVKEITFCMDNGNGMRYFVDGERADQEAFTAAIDAHSAKPEPAWYAFADGQLRPWLPEGMELADQTDPDRDSGEAKLWLEGGEIPWLEWNGSTTRLGGLITPAQTPLVYCRDFDSDGQDEVVVSWYINGFAQLDLYEWRDGSPVLADTYDTQQILVRFNQNNVAAVGPYGDSGEYALSISYIHQEGEDTPESTDFYRHFVTGRAILPHNFFDGYEQLRNRVYSAYANQFHLFYLQDETKQFYFDFDLYLADETMQELNYVDTLLAEPPYSQYAGHYMLSKAVGVGGFLLGYDGTGWKLTEWDQLTMDYDGDPTIPPPSAAPEPTPSQTPEPTPSAAPAVCEHGLDSAVFEFADGILVMFCEEDGTRYPVPDVTAANYEGHMRGDFDGDGRMELSFTRTDPDFSRDDGTLLVADVVDGRLQTYVFDPAYLADEFNSTVTYELVDEYQALDFTYQGYGMRVDLSEQWSAMMNHGRSYYPYASARETGYTFTREWAGGAFDMAMPVWLEGGFGGHICYLSWGLRYTGSGFQLVSGSFGYQMP